mgnify:CR=1 FL=1
MHTYSMELGGRTLTMEIGKIAKQANGAVLVRYGDTAVVVAVTGTKTPREGVDFFPLTVDFEEKMYAVGKIPGGFIKREGRPGEQAILTSRLIDRPIRPMFPDGYHNDVQIVATAVSVDPDNAPDMPAMIGASCALSISDIPFEGPIAGVRVGLVDGEFVINPTVEQAKVSLLLACLRKIILLIPLIFILPHLLPDPVFGVFLAEPVSDILAATITTITFFARFDKILDRGAAHV